MFGGMRLGAVTRRGVEEFLTALRETGTRRGKKGKRVPLSAPTINKALSVLKSILAAAVEQGAMTENPSVAVQPIRVPDRDDRDVTSILKPEEILRLLDAAEEPYRSLYRLAVYSGMRRGEILALRWSDVDLHRGRVHVRRTRGRVKDGEEYRVVDGPVKTRASRRPIDVSRSVLLALPTGDSEGDYVFRNRAGEPIDPDNLVRVFDRHLTLAGLPPIRFHDLRHTHASLLIAADVNVKAIQVRLGHSKISTTLDVYGHLLPSAFQGVCERLDSLIQGTNKAQTERVETAVAS